MLLATRRGIVGRRLPASLRPGPGMVAIGLTVVLAAGLVAAAAPEPAGGDLLAVADTDRAVNLQSYGRHGSELLGYRHGQVISVRFELVNPGLAPTTLTTLDAFPQRLGLLTTQAVLVDGRPLPAAIAAGERALVEVTGRFGNCAYYTERAVNVFGGAVVRWRSLGMERSGSVAYPDQVVVRSPTILDCPGRVLDRSAKQRNAEGTVTGR